MPLKLGTQSSQKKKWKDISGVGFKLQELHRGVNCSWILEKSPWWLVMTWWIPSLCTSGSPINVNWYLRCVIIIMWRYERLIATLVPGTSLTDHPMISHHFAWTPQGSNYPYKKATLNLSIVLLLPLRVLDIIHTVTICFSVLWF